MAKYYLDLCYTTVRENTTYGFVKFTLIRRREFTKLLNYYFVTSKFFSLVSKLLGKRGSLQVDLVVLLLKGIPREALYNLAEHYADSSYRKKRRDSVHEFCQARIAAGDQFTLLSASLDPVVSAYSRLLKMPYASSELEYDDSGDCQGKFKNNISGHKSELLKADQLNFMITDNFEDFEMHDKVQKFYVVLKKAKHRSFWEAKHTTKVEYL
jgi:phosphoserine phosphatase